MHLKLDDDFLITWQCGRRESNSNGVYQIVVLSPFVMSNQRWISWTFTTLLNRTVRFPPTKDEFLGRSILQTICFRFVCFVVSTVSRRIEWRWWNYVHQCLQSVFLERWWDFSSGKWDDRDVHYFFSTRAWHATVQLLLIIMLGHRRIVSAALVSILNYVVQWCISG